MPRWVKAMAIKSAVARTEHEITEHWLRELEVDYYGRAKMSGKGPMVTDVSRCECSTLKSRHASLWVAIAKTDWMIANYERAMATGKYEIGDSRLTSGIPRMKRLPPRGMFFFIKERKAVLDHPGKHYKSLVSELKVHTMGYEMAGRKWEQRLQEARKKLKWVREEKLTAEKLSNDCEKYYVNVWGDDSVRRRQGALRLGCSTQSSENRT